MAAVSLVALFAPPYSIAKDVLMANLTRKRVLNPQSRLREEAISHLPGWAQNLARRYYTKTLSTFICFGAVRDLQPGTTPVGERRYIPLKQFLSEELFESRDYVLYYDRSSGIRMATPEMQRDFGRVVEAYDSMYGTAYGTAIPKDPGRALPLIESFSRARLGDGKSIAVIIDYAETIAPAGDATTLASEDRYTLVTLTKWAQDPQFLSSDFSLVLIAENMTELSPRLSRHPYAALIELSLPTEEERAEYLRFRIAHRPPSDVSTMPVEVLAQLTSGLSRVQLSRIMNEALAGERITEEELKLRKKEIIQAECHGLLEFLEPKYTLDVVAGHQGAKDLLRNAAKAIKEGHREVVPMGYLVSGPVGTGKTFLTTCFAGEIGIPCVKFLNFRSQWQGVTEGNLERIFNILKAMYPVAVIIDEADTMLGNRSASGDSGTSARVFGSIAAFMGNTEYRGRIVWFLLTARPDLLPIDLKRQGRAEEHIALFYPETVAERDELFAAMAKKTQTDVGALSPASLIPPGAPQMSGADLEAALVRAKARAVAGGRTQVSEDDLRATFADFIPPSYPLEVEMQTLVAVQECTSRAVLPEKYRSMDRSEVVRRVRELKLMIELP
jgi:SpoVK/Ycf46/Vps4 family AAA+-type ATPase